MPHLNTALNYISENSHNSTEKGRGFESLVKIYLENDDVQKQYYEKIEWWSDWASKRDGFNKNDTGIDLVAKIRGKDTFASIQAKFYHPDNPVSKADLDSWISRSTSDLFTEMLLFDTSNVPLNNNAQNTIDNLSNTKSYRRVRPADIDKSRIDWSNFIEGKKLKKKGRHPLKPHQKKAIKEVKDGLKDSDRGQLIMACGTGKTFTALRLTEEIINNGSLVLYMVPSLALMSQTVHEWKSQSLKNITAFSVCSDQEVGKNQKDKEDKIRLQLSDLAFPATTSAKELASRIKFSDKNTINVIFATYHSIDVISKAQKKYKLNEFDFIICDEAHRTTGEKTLSEEKESHFVKIHKNENVKAKKRLYMTATPKIYTENAKKTAGEQSIELSSMDDEKKFGKRFHHLSFGEAVEDGLLTDYKVVVFTMDEEIVSDKVQALFSNPNSPLQLKEATKIVGCFKALAKEGFSDSTNFYYENINGRETKIKSKSIPMRRAIAFTQKIELSKIFTEKFTEVIEEYVSDEKIEENYKPDLNVETRHIDGGYNADQRQECLNWLKSQTDNSTCRILSNAKCLTEGVDIPALDAVIFLKPRKSKVDVVQAVGRVMRKDPENEKKMGYVILPITIPAGSNPENVLDNDKDHTVIWQVLSALRSHDERLASVINRLEYNEDVSKFIEIVNLGREDELKEITGEKKLKNQIKNKKNESDDQDEDINEESNNKDADQQEKFGFTEDELSKSIKAKIVDKVGNRDYFEVWARDIAEIAEQHIIRIRSLVTKGSPEKKLSFKNFLEEIRDDLNPEVTEDEAIEMLAQHVITKPIFNALFAGNDFARDNPVSKAMETVIEQIDATNIRTESRSLDKLYASVQMKVADINSAELKQDYIIKLYNGFFKNAFPRMSKKLGIVYTPVEIVDFINTSVAELVKEEFNLSLSDKNVHILDPFSGTGTFITRLIDSDLINKEKLKYKYENELHANEIVLLAYYIACINIEAVYQNKMKENQYQQFEGMVLTDTFHLFEQDRDMIANLLPDNSSKRTAQKARDIKIILGNPPYSGGQTSANDDAANIRYPNLDAQIEINYGRSSKAVNKNYLYDSYIRAFRWASERIGDEGVIGFVTNAGWIDGAAMDGFRHSLYNEFSKIYVFNLRGNARTKGELRKKEKGNVFGSGSRSPIAITILVKNNKSKEKGKIYIHDIGDYLDREKKLEIIKNFNSIKAMQDLRKFKFIKPDKNNNWINQGESDYLNHTLIGDKKNLDSKKIFIDYSIGIQTNRDSWSYNYSKSKLKKNISSFIKVYNEQLKSDIPYENVIKDHTKIKWSSSLENIYKRKIELSFDNSSIRTVSYRPFTNTNVYFSNELVHRRGSMQIIFPHQEVENLTICSSGIGSKQGFSCLMTNQITDLQLVFNGQCFPLYIYKKNEENIDLFSQGNDNLNKRYSINNSILLEYQSFYKDKKISEKDIFFYIYGILHSEEYRKKFSSNLIKELPRIPKVKNKKNFQIYSISGRELSKLHTDYDNTEKFSIIIEGNPNLKKVLNPKSFFKVTQMRFKNKEDKSTIIYNDNITIKNIPLEAYNYIINDKSALEWIMERQCISKNSKTGIIDDANDYANETMNNPAYPLELFQRIITVSLETMKIVKSLPKLDI